MNYAYTIAWIGELGGIQYIQIASDSPETITRVGKWPVPVLLNKSRAASFQSASEICRRVLAEKTPEWSRFLRSPARMQSFKRPTEAVKAKAKARAPR